MMVIFFAFTFGNIQSAARSEQETYPVPVHFRNRRDAMCSFCLRPRWFPSVPEAWEWSRMVFTPASRAATE